jgi:manganese transport system substrate-binding protein
MVAKNRGFPRLKPYQLVLSLLVMGVWLVSCTSSDNGTSNARKDKKVVLTTFTVLADMTQNVAGDRVIVESLISDLKRGRGAHLILDNGFNLERWAVRYYSNFPQVPRITLSQGVQPIEIAEDTYRGKPNPHAWMSPKNALIYVNNIRIALEELDPPHAATYKANANRYSQQIRAIDAKLKRAIAVIPANRRYIVSCEGAFSYLARDYGLKEVYLWAVNSERQTTPKQVKQVIDTVRVNRIPAVFCESTVNNEIQLQVAKETGAKFGGAFYVDSLSPPEGKASTYLKLLEYNVNTLIIGLKGE